MGRRRHVRVARLYVTLRGFLFELEDHEAGSDSDDDGKVGVVRAEPRRAAAAMT